MTKGNVSHCLVIWFTNGDFGVIIRLKEHCASIWPKYNLAGIWATLILDQ